MRPVEGGRARGLAAARWGMPAVVVLGGAADRSARVARLPRSVGDLLACALDAKVVRRAVMARHPSTSSPRVEGPR